MPWTVAHQAPLSMGSLQARTLEWVLLNPGIEPRSPILQADSLLSEPINWANVSCFIAVKWLRRSKICLHLYGILIFWGCFKKSPQIWCLKTTETYSFIVLEDWSLKWRCQQGMSFLKSLGENQFHVTFLDLGGYCNICYFLAIDAITPIQVLYLHVQNCLCFLFL